MNADLGPFGGLTEVSAAQETLHTELRPLVGMEKIHIFLESELKPPPGSKTVLPSQGRRIAALEPPAGLWKVCLTSPGGCGCGAGATCWVKEDPASLRVSGG